MDGRTEGRILMDQLISIDYYVVMFDLVAPNAFPDTSSQFCATVYLMLATTIVFAGGTAFAAMKTYPSDKSKGANISLLFSCDARLNVSNISSSNDFFVYFSPSVFAKSQSHGIDLI